MKILWTLMMWMLIATLAPAQEPPRDLSLLAARYQNERRIVDDGYAHGVATLNNRYIIGFRNMETSFTRRGDAHAATLARQEREALENEVAALPRRLADLADAREPSATPALAAEALAPLPDGTDSIQIIEILPADTNPIPLEENLLVRARFKIASVETATITLRISNKGMMFMASGRPFTSKDDEWEFSVNSPTPREADKIELEIRDPRTNRLYAKAERKMKIVWK